VKYSAVHPDVRAARAREDETRDARATFASIARG